MSYTYNFGFKMEFFEAPNSNSMCLIIMYLKWISSKHCRIPIYFGNNNKMEKLQKTSILSSSGIASLSRCNNHIVSNLINIAIWRILVSTSITRKMELPHTSEANLIIYKVSISKYEVIINLLFILLIDARGDQSRNSFYNNLSDSIVML